MAGVVRLSAPSLTSRRLAPAAVSSLPGRWSGSPAAAVPGLRRFAQVPDNSGEAAGSAPARPPPTEGLWGRFVRWSYRNLGDRLYPVKADICNCGADLGVLIPKPELVMREGIKPGSTEWRMQLYGASLYWHLATTPTEKSKEADPNWMTGKDVLEVACMRGGGARYLAEVARPHRYVATDSVEEHIARCKETHSPVQGLEFQCADAMQLAETYPAESFDFVLCVQAISAFEDVGRFVSGAARVLRPGGRLIIADALSRVKLESLLLAVQAEPFVVDATSDLSRAVHAVGLCPVPAGISYLRFVARKVEWAQPEAVDQAPEQAGEPEGRTGSQSV